MISMADFMIRFLISNLVLSSIIGLLFFCKRILKIYLTSRMQYHLGYVMISLLSVPFLPLPMVGFTQIFSRIVSLTKNTSFSTKYFPENTIGLYASDTVKSIQDFALSVSRETSSPAGYILFGIWITGIFTVILSVIRAERRLNRVKCSALPLQNKEIRLLYKNCLNELNITADIPIYSTAFLRSPILVGIFRPAIYLPSHVISDCPAIDLRYMLLHELQHFRHKDTLTGYLMVLAGIPYWFNPLVWYALREMRNDREIACDTSVLEILKEKDYDSYGYALISFAEKLSLASFPSSVGISGDLRQMQRRILNISSYKKPSVREKTKGCIAFCTIVIILLGLAPLLSTYAVDRNHYKWDTSSETISVIDLSPYFHGYNGSFVLYDLKKDTWNIYDMEQATLRTSPNSTYKIYDALFGLEERIITPQDSFMAWDGTDFPFKAWNTDQDLYSAMHASVNWYFQEIDSQLGESTIKHYVREIGYGNKEISSDLSSYWIESSLKISPVEQVMLLTDLYRNHFDFSPENIEAVKKSICLFSSENQNLYAKTGTGRTEGQDRNGWFIGFLEIGTDTYFFATNIQNDTNASGSQAASITMSILHDKNLWPQ